MPKSDYYERKEERIERYEELAKKAKQRSENAFHASREATKGIPPGQPILVGHHSEKRHRNALARAHKAMDRMVEEGQKADYWNGRAIAAESNTAISSDNPDAIDLLREKLAALEKEHFEKKEFRADFRRWKKNPKIKISDKWRGFFEKAVTLGVEPVADYELPYLKREIKRVKDRIAELEAQAEMVTETVNVGPVEIVSNVEENRVQIFFPDKPAEAVRTDLKKNGFRWSPRAGAWQRHMSNWAVRLAKEIVTEHYGDKAVQ